MRALWRAEDFPPLFFGEKCESSDEQRIFLPCFPKENANPLASRGFFSFLKFFLLHLKRQFHDLIRPVVDSGFFIFYNVVAHIAEQCFFFQKQFHHLKRVRDIPAL